MSALTVSAFWSQETVSLQENRASTKAPVCQLVAFTQAFCGKGAGDALAALQARSLLLGNLWFLAVCFIAATPGPKLAWQWLMGKWPVWGWLRPAAAALLLAASYILLVGQSYNPFLYFRF